MRTNTTFVFFAYGKLFIHHRTLFCIYSLFASNSIKATDTILIYTDDILFYTDKFPFKNIEFIKIDKEYINTVLGDIDLIHKFKIFIIDNAFKIFPNNNVFYMDSDTFAMKNLRNVIDSISSKSSIMHLYEFNFFEHNTNNKKDISSLFFANFYEIIIKEHTPNQNIKNINSYNAGVIGIDSSNKNILKEVFDLTEKSYKAIQHHAAEQFSFSYLLSKYTTINFCSVEVYHYWPKVEKQIMDKFLNQLFTNTFFSSTTEKQLSKVKKATLMLPNYIKNHKLMLEDNAIQFFCTKEYSKAYKETIKALFKGAIFDTVFLKDVIYYTKKKLTHE
ncbi:MAG: hypothetical protein R2801_02955 [Chitinophagales bacterium]